MQVEEQKTATAVPPADSDDSKPKSNRGGKRPGAGRKPNIASRLLKGLSRDTLGLAVQEIDVKGVITGMLKSNRERTRLETLVFVWDRLYGRPAQNVNVAGGVVHAHTVWRPLETLTDEELRLLDSVTKKLSAPASDASPDGQQNQIESKPAIEAVEVGVREPRQA